MNRLLLAIHCVAVAFATAAPEEARAQDGVREADVRLLAIAERVQQANVALCEQRQPSLGVALQSRDQFPADQDPGFRADVAFAVVLPNSVIARAGIAEGDGLLAVGGRAVTRTPGLEGMPLRDSAHAMLAEQGPNRPLHLTVATDGAVREVELEPGEECRALVEVLAGRSGAARSDGRVIQIGQRLIARASDEEVAAIFAHELAHAVLRHRQRLVEEGVSKGLGGEFGRNRQLNAQVEVEADRLSVHLLANAGYDPRIAAALWRGRLGREIDAGLFRSRIYSSPDQRAETLEREVADYLAGGAPSWPGHLLGRR